MDNMDSYYYRSGDQDDQLLWDEDGNLLVDNELYTWEEVEYLFRHRKIQAVRRVIEPVEVCHRGGRRYEVIQNVEERI